jgi:hypothetical protein
VVTSPVAPGSTFALAGDEYVSPSVVNDALDCLAAKQNYGSFVPPTTLAGHPRGNDRAT